MMYEIIVDIWLYYLKIDDSSACDDFGIIFFIKYLILKEINFIEDQLALL